MSKITERQRHIINFIRNHEDESVKLNDIVNEFKGWYYHNGRKHVSDIVFRMLKSGKLVKPKHGYYKLNDNPSKPFKGETDPNQTNLF